MNEYRQPENWGQDSLSGFVEMAYQNSFGIFDNAEWKPHYERLRDIDALFHCILADDWINPPHVLPAFLFMCTHSAYLGAARLSLSAQRPEAYMVMRGCLEASIYAFHLFENPSDTQTYIQRDTDANSKKACIKVFSKTGAMFDALAKHSELLGSAVRELYEDSILFGGHPNLSALVGNMRQSQNEAGIRWELDYLTDAHDPILLCLRNNAQVGVVALGIFGLIFPDRFAEVDAKRHLDQLSRGL